jgi:putative toxin-antitoxin system antitoxin component (TIGR02293 family)
VSVPTLVSAGLKVAEASAVWGKAESRPHDGAPAHARMVRRESATAAFTAMSESWANPSLEAVTAIEQGLPFSALDDIDDLLPDTLRRIIPRSTLAAQKKKSDTLTPSQGERLYQAGKVFGFAMTVFGDREKARRFLTRPHMMLDDRTPLDIALESGAGADLVVNLLGRGAYGGGA